MIFFRGVIVICAYSLNIGSVFSKLPTALVGSKALYVMVKNLGLKCLLSGTLNDDSVQF
tara:strand:+ start:708 stop:884 length:177 start_codon:yes stop_codon:yes gene_type:complete